MNLWIRTDQPEAEVAIINSEGNVVAAKKWHAFRSLGVDLLPSIISLAKNSNVRVDQLQQIYVYQGPGSFTGLRIGISAANTLAYCLSVPIVGVNDQEWANKIQSASKHEEQYILPDYGREPHITKPKK